MELPLSADGWNLLGHDLPCEGCRCLRPIRRSTVVGRSRSSSMGGSGRGSRKGSRDLGVGVAPLSRSSRGQGGQRPGGADERDELVRLRRESAGAC